MNKNLSARVGNITLSPFSLLNVDDVDVDVVKACNTASSYTRTNENNDATNNAGCEIFWRNKCLNTTTRTKKALLFNRDMVIKIII